MNATVMAIILVLIVVATVVTKKVPFNFVLFIVPIICSLLLGFSLQETSDFVLEQFSSIMKSAGFMLLFAFLYFQMLTEAGVFDTIVSAVTNKLGDECHRNYDPDIRNCSICNSDRKLYTGVPDHIPDPGTTL